MKQFHAKFAGQDAVDKMANDDGFEEWTQLFQDRFDITHHTDRPHHKALGHIDVQLRSRA